MKPAFAVSIVVTQLFLSVFAHAAVQTVITLVDHDNRRMDLSSADTAFIRTRLDTILQNCNQPINITPLKGWPKNTYRFMAFTNSQGHEIRIYVDDSAVVTRRYNLFVSDGNSIIPYGTCNNLHSLPVIAVITETVDLCPDSLCQPEPEGESLKQEIIARTEFLTSHEPNILTSRIDTNEISRLYMDFKVSMKYPVWRTGFDKISNIFNDHDDSYTQLYFAFTGRFSQYIGSRKSQPVVAKRFNPQVFVRQWFNENNYLDVIYGHESNGQRVDEEIFSAFAGSFIVRDENNNPVPDQNARLYARDYLSRGWDYWGFELNNRPSKFQYFAGDEIRTTLSHRHFLKHGLFQTVPEEFSGWEIESPDPDETVFSRPRKDYDGLSASVQYLFGELFCVLPRLCLDKFEITQTTGYSRPFEHNTTELELTTDVWGFPLYVWTRSGYNSDFIDYYDYVNSWGIGVELLSR